MRLPVRFRRLTIAVPAAVALVAPGDSEAQESAGAPTRLAIRGVTLIDGTGADPRADVTVVIENGRIAALLGGAELPPGATVVDGRGRFLMPGLWDMHVHLTRSADYAPLVYLANGVTGLRDMGGDWEVVRALRDSIDAGTLLGPRIKGAGPMLESPARVDRIRRKYPYEQVGRTRVPVADSAAGARVVDSLAAEGVDFIKFRTLASREAFHGIAAAARARGLPLAGHSGGPASPDELVRAGQWTVEHPVLLPLHWRPPHERRRLMRRLARSGMAIVPTLVNFHEFFMMPRDRAYVLLADTSGVIDPRRRLVGAALLRDWHEQVTEDVDVRRPQLRRWLLRRVYASVTGDLRALHRSGVRILPGTDLTVAFIYPGFSLHDELRYFVTEIGMTPMEAVVSATRWPAELLGLRDSLGTIEPGKVADLVLLDADPSADIANTRRIVGVFARGRYFDRAALDAMLARAASVARAEQALPDGPSWRQSP